MEYTFMYKDGDVFRFSTFTSKSMWLAIDRFCLEQDITREEFNRDKYFKILDIIAWEKHASSESKSDWRTIRDSYWKDFDKWMAEQGRFDISEKYCTMTLEFKKKRENMELLKALERYESSLPNES